MAIWDEPLANIPYLITSPVTSEILTAPEIAKRLPRSNNTKKKRKISRLIIISSVNPTKESTVFGEYVFRSMNKSLESRACSYFVVSGNEEL